jgi:amidase
MIEIRPAAPADAASWLEMRRALWPPEEGEPPDGHAREIEQYFAGELSMPLEVLIAHDGSRRVGFVELSIRPYAEGCTTDRVAFLEGWYVVPEARRKGVGRTLIEASERWGLSQGCTELGSDALLENDVSAAAHHALGFEEVVQIRCFRKDLRETRSQMIDRREFLKRGGAAGAGLSLAAAGCGPEDTTGFPITGAGRFSVSAFELDEATVQELTAAMESGERTSRSITELYLERIEQLDRRGPMLRSVIESNPDAPDIAEELDAERAAGRVRGPLHGIPVLLKDNIDTHDRNTTTAGSLALEGSIPAADAFIAARLREAGAVLIGKANMSEWANFRGNPSVSGWSARGGQCRNPYALDRTPCGSSSGSGAAVASNLAPIAVGTETDGSIVCPSSICGIVGVKPTVGLASRSGIIPISHSQDTAGPMARSVWDAAALLGALTGVDPNDPATLAAEGNTHRDYTQFLDAAGLNGARIGLARESGGFRPPVLALLDQAAAAFRDGGATVVDAGLPEVDGDAELLVLAHEFKADIEKYLRALGPDARVRTLADLIAFNTSNADRELAIFGQELFVQSQGTGGLTDRAYLDALASIQRTTRAGIDNLMAQNNLDAIAVPTMGPGWVIDPVLGDHSDTGSSSSPGAVAGYPTVTVPMGFLSGLPVGISFVGRAWSEPVLLRIAYAYEQATKHRRPPTFQATAV